MSETAVIACAAAGEARGLDAAAAAVAVAATPLEGEWAGTVLLDLRAAAPPPRGTLLAAPAARSAESACRQLDGLSAAARGRLCFATARDPEGVVGPAALLEQGLEPGLLVCVCDPVDFRERLAEVRDWAPAALVRAAPRSNRPLLALLAGELSEEGVPLKVWVPSIGLIPARRALAGLEPGGESGRRAARFAGRLMQARGLVRPQRPPIRLAAEGGQALPAVLAIALVTVAVGLILLALGGAATAKGRLQRAVDLAALSAARSMRDDFPRLFAPARKAGGMPNPEHLERSEYLARARAVALDAAERNGLDPGLLDVTFPDASSFAPVRVVAEAQVAIGVGGADAGGETDARAEAEMAPDPAGTAPPPIASGGGYSGVLAYRQGKPMRPDVAAAFDRMSAAAREDGIALLVTSGYRSDAEQRVLWEQNPDPRMVAPPGTSLHRCGTELDLGPPEAYGWLAAHATEFGFLQRYSWEAWHYGFTAGPAPCSAEGARIGAGAAADGDSGGAEGLPGFVPERFRRPLIESASRRGVSAALLAAQLMAESNFNPAAVSPAGAQGIAQFMPATAVAYGLDDPFDPEAAIDAQARMMAELLSRFGAVELALAAYNAGPGAVEPCGCVPPYPETQAYVARIMGLLGGAGELSAPAPALEVRLVA